MLRAIVMTLLAGTGLAGTASAATVYWDSFQSGPPSEWVVSEGSWEWTPLGLSNDASGENRVFLDALSGLEQYAVSVSAVLDQGNGWALFFGADLDGKNRVSGYTFQYDPGYGGGAYLLRDWSKNKESVLASVAAPLDLGVGHDFQFDVTATSFRAVQDGVEVLSFDGALSPAGDLLGFRTWSNSDATFANFQLASVPEPSCAALLAGGSLLLMVRRGYRA